ncbi:helix-turn-helix transcriptional regulator [Bacillus sp. ISL-34]|uniref:PadR family transcriptional regulator n=1 Tax=Bacillus sp. ISL-34 TaxID=2819121 RepID=UPI001BE7BE7D|nr:helix-turn-helix transcriptional regulator [Bacillus sp. ISL-34]MBT2647477.1 helix-turn-helix transcriptional regulator [Bacillus sp. ISL-34]
MVFLSKVRKLIIVMIYAKTELLKGSTEMVLLSLLAQKDMYGYEMIEQQLNQLSEGYYIINKACISSFK